MLPEAEVAFLDEVFLGSTAILNTLLGVLDEGLSPGQHPVQCPLRVCVGAANTLPEDHTLAAFADRFLARLFVESVSDGLLEEMLEVGWAARTFPKATAGSCSMRSTGWPSRRGRSISARCVRRSAKPSAGCGPPGS